MPGQDDLNETDIGLGNLSAVKNDISGLMKGRADLGICLCGLTYAPRP